MSFNRNNNYYSIPLPVIQRNSFNFKFSVPLPDGNHLFTFNWIWKDPHGEIQNAWYFSDLMPSGEVRNGRISPNAVNWSKSSDMGIYFKTSLQNVGQNDLNQVQMFAMYWT